jgi:serine/threonine-protein kinase PknG
MSRRCTQPGCTGTIAADGYCDTCGAKAPAQRDRAPAHPRGKHASHARHAPAASAPSAVSASARSGSTQRTSDTSRSTSRRTAGIGAGLVDIAPAPVVDPSAVVLEDATIPEDKRFCSNCGAPVGRPRPDAPHGRIAGICSQCRHRFDFEPKLRKGEIVGGQYEVVGPMAHGGLGWIYLARDRAVNDRWVVLKGLLDARDEAAMRVAVAERQFLAELSHPGIVGIFNFVTDRGSGYIVEEYIGGRSLKQLLAQRRAANGGKSDPLPVADALAFILAIVPAFAYLHSRALLYCDFKPDNLIQVGDQVKLIDLGAVRRFDDPSPDVYGTVGYQAPEIAQMGPSVPSDIYTFGRTLAVLTLDFRGYQKEFEHSLPDPAAHAALADFNSFYRLLLKATAPHPDDRFQSVGEFGEQALGVLRDVVARTTGKPQPAASNVFGPPPEDETLPVLSIDASDPAAAFLINLSNESPQQVLSQIHDAVAAGTVRESIEVRLRIARAFLDIGDTRAAAHQLEAIEKENAWEWRAAWLRGVLALGSSDLAAAATAFDRCRSEAPGEVAPKLAAAITAERAGDTKTAAALYDIVATVDPSYVEAARGLARCRAAGGDVAGALAAYDRVPVAHRAHADAQLAAVELLIASGQFQQAGQRLTTLDGLDDRRRLGVEAELFEGAVHALTSGTLRPDATTSVGNRPLTERSLRLGLEAALRRRAHLTADPEERIALVDRANRERPLTLL